jgi:hypothetical protein
MTDFTKIPEAMDFIAGQSWLSPDEPVTAAAARGPALSPRGSSNLGWRDALREIADTLGRVGRNRPGALQRRRVR